MKMGLDAKESEDVLLCIVLSIVLASVILLNINKYDGIIIVNDEFGYWGIAANIAGRDWSDLMSTTPYYAFGYSLLLIPLQMLQMTASQMYMLAIVMNVMMLIISFWVAITCSKYMFPEWDRRIAVIACFVLTLYTNTLVQAQIAWSETLVYFLFWMVFYFVIKIDQNSRWEYYIILGFLCGYMYFSHQRTIGVIISVVAVLFFKNILNDREPAKFIVFIISVGGMIFVGNIIKQYCIDNIYVGNALVSSNDYGGQISKIKYILGSVEGMIYFVESLVGKIYYLLSGTFFLAIIALKELVVHCFQMISFNLKKRAIVQLWPSFLFLAVMISVLISAVFLNAPIGRLDLLLYGRYMEFTIGPLLLYGIGLLLNNEKWDERIVYIAILFVLLISFVIDFSLSQVLSEDFNSFCTVNVAYFFRTRTGIGELVYRITAFFGGIGLLLIVICNRKILKIFNRNMRSILVLALLGGGWIFLFKAASPAEAHNIIKNDIQPIIEVIQDNSNLEEVYYAINSDDINLDANMLSMKYIQYYCPDIQIKFVGLNEINRYCSKYFVIANSDIKTVNKENIKILAKSDDFTIIKMEE